MEKRLDILIVYDDLATACALAKQIRHRHDVRIAQGAHEALGELARRPADAVLTSLELPHVRGDTLLALIAVDWPDVRRILHSSGIDARVHYAKVAHLFVSGPLPVAHVLAHIEARG
jgi:DNA-binding NtrC family response regulator